MGWDDNGLNVERRVQLTYGVTCDPSLPFDPEFVAPATPPKQPIPIFAPELRRAVRRAHRGARAGVPRALDPGRPLGRLAPDVHDDRHEGPPHVAACIPPPADRGARALGRSTDPVGRRLQDIGRPSRARGPRATRRVLPHRLSLDGERRARLHRDDPPRASGRVRCRRRASRRRPVQAAVRHDCPHTALRRRGARRRAPARRSREGLGHRDDLHVRRHDRRDLVARARPAGAFDRGARRPHRRGAALGHRSRRPVERDHGPHGLTGADAHGRAAHRVWRRGR